MASALRRWCAGAVLAQLLVALVSGAQASGSRGIRASLPLLRERQQQALASERGRSESCGSSLPHRLALPNATHQGFVGVSGRGDEMFTMFYEAQLGEIELETRPIVLWLQGGPGCSSLFGMLYINGPYWLNEDLTLRANPGSWNRLYGLLYVEQPIATGFSRRGKRSIPSNELEVAEDLYKALNNWYRRYPQYQRRPLIVTGESYAGKYVPSISHYILQADAMAHGYLAKLDHPRDLGSKVEAPLFRLGGLAVGNGWTDADSQQMVQGDVAWAMGLIDLTMKRQIDALNNDVVDQLKSKNWVAARALSDQVNALISNWSATQTLEDVRRNTGYDGRNTVDTYLNLRHVKQMLGIDQDVEWVSCSPEVDRKMGHDVMKSVRPQVVDLLQFHPVLLYQGQFDAECGVASNDVWIQTMKWPGHYDFNHKLREVWTVNGRALGYWRQHLNLTQLVIRNTGHMVPHDHPYYGQLLLERWIEERVRGRQYTREFTEEEEQLYLCMHGSDEGPTAGPSLPAIKATASA